MSNTVVATNVMSLNSHRALRGVGGRQANAAARLSSGYRINSAADDAAGLSISEKMRAQIRGLDQASRNAQDGISLIQTAEGGMQEVNDMLQRIRELLVQVSNDTNENNRAGTGDRQKIQDEINQLVQEIDNMSTRVEFNRKALISGDFSDPRELVALRRQQQNSAGDVKNAAADRLSTAQGNLRAANEDFLAFTGDQYDQLISAAEAFFTNRAVVEARTDFYDALDDLMLTLQRHGFNTNALTTMDYSQLSGITGAGGGGIAAGMSAISVGGATIHMGGLAATEAEAVAISNAVANFATAFSRISTLGSEGLGSSLANALTSFQGTANAVAASGGLHATRFHNYQHARIEQLFLQMTGADQSAMIVANNAFRVASNAFVGTASENRYNTLRNAVNSGQSAVDASKLERRVANQALNRSADQLNDAIRISRDNRPNSIYFQVGANAFQSLELSIGSVASNFLGIGDGFGNTTIDVVRDSGRDITMQIQTLDEALSYVGTERSKLGAAQNRLEHTIKSLDVSSENLSASESRIRDADMAKEMMNFTQANVLQQAAISMLAQANQAPQNVLQLL